MIYALITLYNPSESVLKNIITISKQTDKIFLCDNSKYSNESLFKKIKNCEYLFFNNNLGLSKAFNKVLKNPLYLFHDEDFIFFFDQDSFIDEFHTKKMIEEYEKIEKSGVDIGCLGPVFTNLCNNKIEIPKIKQKIIDDTYLVSSIITSSMLCRFKEIKEIDFWNEEIFLDMADWDFCWRMKKAKKQCCMTESVVFKHQLGNGEKKILFFTLRYDKSFREYYQIRECLKLLNKSYTPFKYKVRFVLMLTIRILLRCVCFENGKERFYYYKKGIKDYKNKINGAL